MSKHSKRIFIAAALVVATTMGAFTFHRECAYGGGMPGWYRDCSCKGIERLDYDQTAADGRRRTTCIGLVTARRCYSYQGGPEVPCDTLPPR
jgi:hypothetical protein